MMLCTIVYGSNIYSIRQSLMQHYIVRDLSAKMWSVCGDSLKMEEHGIMSNNKIQIQGVHWYRLVLYNSNGGAEIINFESKDLFEAIDHATRIYHNETHHDGAQLYQYHPFDTCGWVSFVSKIKEPTADE